MVTNRKNSYLVVVFIDFCQKGMKKLGLYMYSTANYWHAKSSTSKSTKVLVRTTTGTETNSEIRPIAWRCTHCVDCIRLVSANNAVRVWASKAPRDPSAAACLDCASPTPSHWTLTRLEKPYAQRAHHSRDACAACGMLLGQLEPGTPQIHQHNRCATSGRMLSVLRGTRMPCPRRR
jgi:hypothetical protein